MIEKIIPTEFTRLHFGRRGQNPPSHHMLARIGRIGHQHVILWHLPYLWMSGTVLGEDGP